MTDEQVWLRLFVQPATPWTQMSEATKDAWLRDLARALRRSSRERALAAAGVLPSPSPDASPPHQDAFRSG